jgi:hypothetical protein
VTELELIKITISLSTRPDCTLSHDVIFSRQQRNYNVPFKVHSLHSLSISHSPIFYSHTPFLHLYQRKSRPCSSLTQSPTISANFLPTPESCFFSNLRVFEGMFSTSSRSAWSSVQRFLAHGEHMVQVTFLDGSH